MNNYEEIITRIVNSSQGIKGVDLSLKVMEEINPHKFSIEEYNKALDELTKTNQILEIEYILPQMDYRIKSFFLPSGTELP
jgi:hypothetical protein